MSIYNIFVVVGILLILFVFAGWLTIKKFNSIESNETDRRKNIEEDVKVKDKR